MSASAKQTQTALWLQRAGERPSLIEYRMQSVAEINGVEYINDSKATDLNATLETLSEIRKPLVLILQTSEFPENYAVLTKAIKYQVITLVVYGTRSDAQLREKLIGLPDHYVKTNSLEEAVVQASKWSKKGDVVLFSPGATSFELFNDYRDRGNAFNQYVERLNA